jgi:hypothetical protein
MRVTMKKPLRLGIDWALHGLGIITVSEGDSLVVDDDFAQGMMNSNVDRPCIVLQIRRFVAIPKDNVRIKSCQWVETLDCLDISAMNEHCRAKSNKFFDSNSSSYRISMAVRKHANSHSFH